MAWYDTVGQMVGLHFRAAAFLRHLQYIFLINVYCNIFANMFVIYIVIL